MISDRYSTLLSDLSKAFHVPLSPNLQNACAITLKDNLTLVIEPDSLSENLIIVIDIGSPQSGVYRQNIFKEALKANGLPPPKNGIFAYSSKKDSLLLCEQVSLENISIPQLLSLFKTLTQKARVWKSAIEKTEIPSYLSTELTFGSDHTSSTKAKGIFGL